MKRPMPAVLLVLYTAMLALPSFCSAQGLAALLPKKQMLIVVPNAAAGPNDYLGRVIQQKLSESLKQNVVVEN